MKRIIFATYIAYVGASNINGEFLCAQNCNNNCELSYDVLTFSPSYNFELEFRALFLKPGASNLHYAVEAIPFPLPSPNWNIFDIHPGYHFGFDLGFRAICHKNNNNFMINWQHISSCDSDERSVPSSDMVGPFFEIGPDASAYTNTKGKVNTNFNEVNMDLGQYVKFGNKFRTNIFAGIGVTSLKQCVNAVYFNDEGTIVRDIASPTSFIGAGPQIGIDFSCCITDRLYFAGRGLCSILTGSSKNHTDYLALSPALQDVDVTPPNKQQTSMQKRSQVVPAFEERIGLSYTFNCFKCYTAKLEVGYQAQVYVGAIQSTDISSEVLTPPIIPDTIGVFARTFHRNISNFTLTGPYLTFNVGF